MLNLILTQRPSLWTFYLTKCATSFYNARFKITFPILRRDEGMCLYIGVQPYICNLIYIFFPQFSNHNGDTPANPDLRIPRQIHIRTVIRAVHDARHAAVILSDSDILVAVPLHDAGHVVGLMPAALEQQPAVRH